MSTDPFEQIASNKDFIAKVERIMKEMNIYFDPRNTADLETTLMLSAHVGSLVSQYEKVSLDVPDKLIRQQKAVAYEIEYRVRLQRETELKELVAARESTATPEERRVALGEQIAKLEKLLGA